jgi:hypothetical protein
MEVMRPARGSPRFPFASSWPCFLAYVPCIPLVSYLCRGTVEVDATPMIIRVESTLRQHAIRRDHLARILRHEGDVITRRIEPR